MSMYEELGKAYKKMRNMIISENYKAHVINIVIQMHPKCFLELRKEETRIDCFNFIEHFDNIFFINLFGRKVPCIINNDLNENTRFVMQTQEEYEREEETKLMEKFYKIFEN